MLRGFFYFLLLPLQEDFTITVFLGEPRSEQKKGFYNFKAQVALWHFVYIKLMNRFKTCNRKKFNITANMNSLKRKNARARYLGV